MRPIKHDPRTKLMLAQLNKLMPLLSTSRDQSVQLTRAFGDSTSFLSTSSRRIKISDRSISISQAGSCLWGDISTYLHSMKCSVHNCLICRVFRVGNRINSRRKGWLVFPSLAYEVATVCGNPNINSPGNIRAQKCNLRYRARCSELDDNKKTRAFQI